MRYIILDNSVTIDGKVINDTHPNFVAIVDALKSREFDQAVELIDIPKTISKQSDGKVTVQGSTVFYNGLPVHSSLADKIVALLSDGYDITPWTRFMERLYQNPDPFAITQAYDFIQRAKLPLTPSGTFLAYKKVRDNYTDCHTGTFDPV